MIDGKQMSKMIRMQKKSKLRPDMDSAGQEALDPNEVWDDKMATDVNETLDDPDHEPASDAQMGEHESSQDLAQLKKSMARIKAYIDAL